MPNIRGNKLYCWYGGVLLALVFPFIGSLIYVFWSDNIQAAYGVIKVIILLWPVLWVFGMRCPLPASAPEKMSVKRAVRWGIFSGVAIAAFLLLFYLAIRSGLGPYMQGVIDTAANWGFTDPIVYIIFSLLLSTIHSGIEEYYWRWFVFRGLLTRFRWRTAALVSSIGFALHHYVVLGQLFPAWIAFIFGTGVLVGGLIWSYMYHKTGRLSSVWISHIFVDLVIFGVGYIIIFG